MAEVTRASGITMSLAGPVKLARPTLAPKRKPGAVKRAAPVKATDNSLLVDALRKQDLEFVDSISLQIPPAARPKKRGAAAPASTAAFDVPLGSNEHALILVEDEGEYRWIVDGKPALVPAQAQAKRGRGKAAVAKKSMRFEIELKAAPPPPAMAVKRGAKRGLKRGWLSDKLSGKVTAFVFRFALKAVGKKAIKYLERNVAQGLVSITRTDPQKWKLLGDKDALPRKLPADRPARVLLFVHGTFSSTVGSFGALGTAPQGRDFLERAFKAYDVVLGFDHPTLSVDPLKNASDMLARLKQIKWPQAPQIDMVAFSRGGLVARSLVEQLLPGNRWRASLGPIVFVGCTNGGTQLAEPDNWHRFADHYTNLALGATRALSFIPGAQGVTLIAGQVVRGISVLVKALATGVITEKLAPGLAAMEPDGAFVTDINRAQTGQPAAADTRYYAVTSDFEAGKALRSGGTPELPPKLLMRIIDWGADAVYGEPNDLVVHVRSMTAIDPAIGNFIKDKFDYGSNGAVYHTNYFTRDETADRLIDWLALSGPDGLKSARAAAKAATKRTTKATTPAKAGPRKRKAAPKKKAVAPRAARKAAPAAAVKKAIKSAEQKRPAMKKPAAKRAPRKAARKSAAKAAAEKPAPRFLEASANAIRGGLPIEDVALAIARPPRVARRPMKGEILTLRAPKRAAKKSGGAGIRKAAKPAASVECHFRAEMDQQVVVDKMVSVDVTIARNTLKISTARTGGTASAEVATDRKLIVQIAERRNFRVDGVRRVDIAVPEPDSEVNLSFDVTGLIAGEEGELWVQVRQGPIPLLTLKLKPRIVARATAGPVVRLPVEQELAAFPPAEDPLDEMRVIECINGDKVQYLYLFDLPSLNIREDFKSPWIDGRDGYITRKMNGIGAAWAGNGKGELEAFETDLKSIGASMFSELMPREMQDLLWEYRDRINSVQIFSMEPFIPWELVYLKDPRGRVIGNDGRFLGEMGLVRWLYDGYPPSTLTLGSGRARYVVPTYRGDMALPEAAGEVKMMKTLFKAKAVKASAYDVQKLINTPGGFDLLHFGGHAEAAGAAQDDARLLLDDLGDGSTTNSLLATTVANTAQLDADGRRPIVVLNACESARMSRSFASMGGFASAFVGAGAGVFIGTHWSVGDAPARTFIEAFYKSFAIRKKGSKPVQLREAVMTARQAARDGGDATWLAYVVYGNPNAVVVPG